MQQVVQREEHVGFAEAGDDVEDVPSKRLQVAVQRLRHTVDGQMHVDVAIRQPARHFFAVQDVVRVGKAIAKLETAVDRNRDR